MSNRTISLNGWQRLWFVVGIMYLLVVAYVASNAFPRDLTINEYLGSASVENGAMEPDPKKVRWFAKINKDVLGLPDGPEWAEVEAVAHNKSTNEFMYLHGGKWSEKTSALEHMKIPHPLTEEQKAQLKEKQMRFFGLAALWWLLPWLGLYLVGVSVTWVTGGFRRHGTHAEF